ncbi:hypothetical protein SAMN05444410_10698 [Hydrobacter penzbergensis]|uniref:Uncharacterized protein n=1 Tax=Hydrobacter penzbergensis TaxID=1235997 RepID=A0A8X8IFV3_9BACT|nr:hypothetical protein [Hydrobacter penzbergensis]SDW83962.1 hypothetical protein SAMN05444410_10698 [Hydrobacter penzbergensis]
MSKNKKDKTMLDVSSGYNEFAKNSKQDKNGKKKFTSVLKKSVKQRSSK